MAAPEREVRYDPPRIVQVLTPSGEYRRGLRHGWRRDKYRG